MINRIGGLGSIIRDSNHTNHLKINEKVESDFKSKIVTSLKREELGNCQNTVRDNLERITRHAH